GDLGIWGGYASEAGTGRFDASGDQTDPFFPDTDPTTFDLGTGFFQEQQEDNLGERINLGQVSKNELFARDDTWGGGVDVKYFWSRYFGVGVEGVGLAAKTNFAGGGLLTLIGRFPFGRFAPYLTGGVGFIDGGATLYKFFNEKHTYGIPPNSPPGTPSQVLSEREYWTVDPVYNHHARGLGQIGAGLEFRIT